MLLNNVRVVIMSDTQKQELAKIQNDDCQQVFDDLLNQSKTNKMMS